MNEVMENRIFICGAQGNLAKVFLNNKNSKFQFLRFSSSLKVAPKDSSLNSVQPIELLPKYIKHGDKLLFLSNGKTKQDHLKLKALISSLRKINPEIFYLSSMSVHSCYRSDYSHWKLELELLVQTFDNWCIIRPGFILSKNFDGLSQVIKSFAKKSFLLLPSNSTKTYVISLVSVDKKLTEIIERGAKNETLELYDVALSMKRISEVLGFRGVTFNLPKMPGGIFLSFMQLLRPFSPAVLQSLFAFAYMPRFNHQYPNQKAYFRKILINDYSKFLRARVCADARIIINVISSQQQLEEYEGLSRGQKFLFLRRIFELVDARKKQR